MKFQLVAARNRSANHFRPEWKKQDEQVDKKNM